MSPEGDPKAVRPESNHGARLRCESCHSRNKIRKGTPKARTTMIRVKHDWENTDCDAVHACGRPPLARPRAPRRTAPHGTPRSAPCRTGALLSFTVDGRMGWSYTCKRQSNDPSTPYCRSGLGSQVLAFKLTERALLCSVARGIPPLAAAGKRRWLSGTGRRRGVDVS